MNTDKIPYLYILMRSDLPSMNPGKAMAQAAHAANAFVHKVEKSGSKKLKSLYDIWKNSTTQGFGTTITLETSLNEMTSTVCMFEDELEFASDVIFDPTYPYMVNSENADLIDKSKDTSERIYLKDGNVMLFRNEMTCAYVFGDKNAIQISAILKKFPLHK